ncbi:hypothetical protein EV649_5021 [Kribbella sp. VKM Ac-2569]|uniref:NACHT domain-containing protein n=1 Tax=Kribbella sp. VKM Ac-2569 TaxID=2512220 RepID=UPI00102B97D3|nr:helix-turn-helix transcriptional regulator [Kribbella sp. VKM Ac-2569]RZT17475.1 hypothetical protein EV649_5021 [Kribbella sp. VKM Ac-2569]
MADEVFDVELRRLRDAAGLFQKQIATLASRQDPPIRVSEQTLSDWFKGKVRAPNDPRVQDRIIVLLEGLAKRRDPQHHWHSIAWWRELRDAQRETPEARRLRARTSIPQGGQLLKSYLAAAQRAARSHPYPGVIQDMPPLAAVYRQQQAIPLGTTRSADADETTAVAGTGSLAAEEALSGDQTCVVLAGPGGGKSSLLRTHLATGMEQWIDGRVGDRVPVLVPAAALTDLPLAQALAAAVNADLATHGLLEPLPSGFFADPPHPGVGWLVLVDGLDEVADPRAQRRILEKLGAVSTGERASLYRFIVATRHLPGGDDVLGLLNNGRSSPHAVPRYELEPFGPEDLEHVARSWFRALGLSEPDQTAVRFAHAIASTKWAELARTPLMACMLCQLHAADPAQPLPASRGDIYDKFVALLYERQHTANVRNGVEGLRRYGKSAVEKAEHTLDHLHDLIAYLAAARSQRYLPGVSVLRQLREMEEVVVPGGSLFIPRLTLAIEIVESRPEAQRPPRVPVDVWGAFLRTNLTRSGLLTEQAGDLVFLHQTLLEYFAMRHLVRDPKAKKRRLQELGTQRVESPVPQSWPRFLRYLIEGVPSWGHQAAKDLSIDGFLIDAVQQTDPSSCLPYLKRLASGLHGAEFVAEQVMLGTSLPDDIVRSAKDVLAALAANQRRRPDYQRVRAARLLIQLHDLRAGDLVVSIAGDHKIYPRDRVGLVERLAERRDPRAADALYVVATDTSAQVWHRLSLAGKLMVDFDDPRGADIWLTLAKGSLQLWTRTERLNDLIVLGDPRARDIVQNLATDPRCDAWRLWLQTNGVTIPSRRDLDLRRWYSWASAVRAPS